MRLEYYEESLQLVLLLPVAPPAPENPEGPQQIKDGGSSVNLMIWPAAQDNGPIR